MDDAKFLTHRCVFIRAKVIINTTFLTFGVAINSASFASKINNLSVGALFSGWQLAAEVVVQLHEQTDE